MEDRVHAAEEKVTLDVSQEIAELEKIAEKLNEMDKALKEEGLVFSDSFNEPIEI